MIALPGRRGAIALANWVAGVDGCRAGWLVVCQQVGHLLAFSPALFCGGESHFTQLGEGSGSV